MKQQRAVIISLIIILGIGLSVGVANALISSGRYDRFMKTSTWRLTEPEPTPDNYKEYDIQPFAPEPPQAAAPMPVEPQPQTAVTDNDPTVHYLLLPGNGLGRVVMDVTAGEAIVSLMLVLIFAAQVLTIVLREVRE